MKSLCLHRINKDLKEIANSPLEGIGIISLHNDPFKYIVNIRIMSGVFEGYCLQLLLTIPEDYPIKPPKILIYPGQIFDNTYHHHIFESNIKDEDNKSFKKFCFDLLENDFLSTSSEAHTGWNSSYTISTLLLQIQIFLSDPDFPNGYIPEKEKIDELFKSMNNYKRLFEIRNEKNEERIIIHKWNNPYPQMYFKSNNNKVNEKQMNINIDKMKEIKENLTCFITKLNYIDDRNIILGYPIKKLGKKSFIPIPEILSYESFIEESTKINPNNENSIYHDFRLINTNINNNNYNTNNNIIVIPDDFFSLFPNIPIIIGSSTGRGRSTLTNAIIGFDNNNNNNNNLVFHSFKSSNNEFYDNWLPIYINDEHFEKNKITILNYFSILKYGNNGLKIYDFHPQYIFEVMPNLLSEMIKKITENNYSSSYLKCFFQYVLLFKKLEKKYNNIYIKYQKFYLEKNINKLYKLEDNIDLVKEILELLVLFLYSDNSLNSKLKLNINNYIIRLNNLMNIQLFDISKMFPFIKTDSLIQDLKLNNLFYKIVDIIFLDSNFLFFEDEYLPLSDILRNKIINQMEDDFLNLYLELDKEIKQKINKILINELNILNYIDIISLYKEQSTSFIESNSFYEYISVFYYLKDKILSHTFLEDLENNFGVYLDTESFIEDLKKKREKHIDITNILAKNNLESIIDIIKLNSFVKNDKLNFNHSNERYKTFNIKTNKYPYIYISKYGTNKIFFIPEKMKRLIKEKEKKYKYINIIKTRKEKIKVKYKEKISRDNFAIKNSYGNKYNKKINKLIDKKNNKRLLLFKKIINKK